MDKNLAARRFMSENHQSLGYDDEDVKAPLLSKKEQNQHFLEIDRVLRSKADEATK